VKILILDCFRVNRSKDFEHFLHNHHLINPSKVTNLPGHEKENELFLIGQELCYQTVIDLIKENIKHFNDLDWMELNNLRTENERLHLEIERLRLQNNAPHDHTHLINLINEKFDTIQNSIQTVVKNAVQNIIVVNSKTTTNFNQPLGTLGPRLQKINPDTMRLIKVYESIAECIKEHYQIKRSSLNKAIRENTIYHNFRWAFVDRDLDPNIVSSELPFTKQIKVQNLGYIAKLNSDKTQILNVYLDRKTAAKMNGISSLDTHVKTGKISNGHYYVLYNSLTDQVKSTFQNDFLLYIDGVGKFDENNNLIREFTSKYDCVYKDNISCKTLNKALDKNLKYNGYIYKRLGCKLFI